MKNIEISVVICTCNRAAMIAQAARSVLEQKTHGSFKYEVLIVDDGSTDNTREVVQRLIAEYGERLRYVYKNGGGVADARNFGVKAAHGEWIAFFDDDQIAEPQWLFELYQVTQNHHAKCVGGSLSLMLPESIDLELGRRSRRVLGERNFGHEVRKYINAEVPGTGNVFFHKQLFELVNGFDVAMREGAEDTDFFSRIRARGEEIWYAPKAHALHVIPESRANMEFLRWVTIKSGVAYARIEYKRQGMAKVILTAFTRLGVTLIRDIPLTLWSALSRNQALQMDCLCASGYTQGFLRGSLHFIAPNLFKQKSFMEFVDFRSHGGERKSNT